MKTWWFIETAPRDATWIEVMMPDGQKLEAHWAQDLSGDEQPPFRGWFVSRPGCSGYFQIRTPELWRDLPLERRMQLSPHRYLERTTK